MGGGKARRGFLALLDGLLGVREVLVGHKLRPNRADDFHRPVAERLKVVAVPEAVKGGRIKLGGDARGLLGQSSASCVLWWLRPSTAAASEAVNLLRRHLCHSWPPCWMLTFFMMALLFSVQCGGELRQRLPGVRFFDVLNGLLLAEEPDEPRAVEREHGIDGAPSGLAETDAFLSASSICLKASTYASLKPIASSVKPSRVGRKRSR
ncbi:MAG: hypothetical protein LBU76_09085 [Azoarcus sp.]|nr:hypothetical protein [Azoarcus sp.]